MPRRSRFIVPSRKYSTTRSCCTLILISAVSFRAYGSLLDDWNGVWKLDPARSHISGPTLRISRSPDGVYHNSGRIGTANFDCDGKGHVVSEGLAVFCTQKRGDSLEIYTSKNGSKVSTAHWELSNHDDTLTIQGTMLQSDGSANSIESRYTRTSGSTGFVGGWRNTDLFKGLPSILSTKIGDNALHFYYPERDGHVDAAIDGSSSPVHTSLFPSGANISLSERSPREFSLITNLNGHVAYIEYWEISADGRSLTESSWFAKRPNEKYVLVYVRQ
jgi:hypothetical protein